MPEKPAYLEHAMPWEAKRLAQIDEDMAELRKERRRLAQKLRHRRDNRRLVVKVRRQEERKVREAQRKANRQGTDVVGHA